MLRIWGGSQDALRRHLMDMAAPGGRMIVIVPEQYTLQTEQELMDNVIGYSRHGEVLIEYLTRTETYHPRSKR